MLCGRFIIATAMGQKRGEVAKDVMVPVGWRFSRLHTCWPELKSSSSSRQSGFYSIDCIGLLFQRQGRCSFEGGRDVGEVRTLTSAQLGDSSIR